MEYLLSSMDTIQGYISCENMRLFMVVTVKKIWAHLKVHNGLKSSLKHNWINT